MNKKAVAALFIFSSLFISLISLRTEKKSDIRILKEENHTVINFDLDEIISIGKITIDGSKDLKITNKTGIFKDIYRIDKTYRNTTIKLFSLTPQYSYGELEIEGDHYVKEIKLFDPKGKEIKSVIWALS